MDIQLQKAKQATLAFQHKTVTLPLFDSSFGKITVSTLVKEYAFPGWILRMCE